MISIWSWIADGVLVLLLTGTLGMVIRLDRALRVVRRDRGAFEALINNLGAATGAVKLGIQALRQEADRAAEQLERRSADADKMATDLSFLIEAADRAGLRLEQSLDRAPGRATETPIVDASGNLPDLASITGQHRVAEPGSAAAVKPNAVMPALFRMVG